MRTKGVARPTPQGTAIQQEEDEPVTEKGKRISGILCSRKIQKRSPLIAIEDHRKQNVCNSVQTPIMNDLKTGVCYNAKDNVGVVENSMILSHSDLNAGKQDNNGTKDMMQIEYDMLDTMMTDGWTPISFTELLMQGKAYTDYNTLNNNTLNENSLYLTTNRFDDPPFNDMPNSEKDQVHDTVSNLCGQDEDESNYTRNDLIPDCNPWDKSIFEKMNIETVSCAKHRDNT
ncbi:hypothetical protein EJB05_08838, partial [Eragrostis curvula]